MRQQQPTALENEYFYRKVTVKGMEVDRLCVRRVLKGTSRARTVHQALP